jgi:hypothetical protein
VAVKVKVAVKGIVAVGISVDVEVWEDSGDGLLIKVGVGLKNIVANASWVCTWKVLKVGVGEKFTTGISEECLSRICPPQIKIGMLKAMAAITRIAMKTRLPLTFIPEKSLIFEITNGQGLQ